MDRLIYHQLQEWRDSTNRKPLVLKGTRQVGKTHLLREFGAKSFEVSHYFNFEKEPGLAESFETSLDPKHIIQQLSFQQKKKIDYIKDLIIFDEIQACPNALTSLKYFCEELPEATVCSAGSLLGIHLGPTSFPVGKVDHMSMYPMSFLEFIMALGDDLLVELLQDMTINSTIPSIAHKQMWERLKQYFIVGGLPEVISTFCEHQDDLFTAFEAVRSKQNDLIEDYYADIAKHSGKINAMHINRILESVPEQLGRDHDGSAKKYKFKNVVPGIDRFNKLASAIDWLESAGLIIKIYISYQGLQPLRSYVKENTFKLFIFDIGILGALSNLSPKSILDYDYGTYKGYFAENFVAQAFTQSGLGQLFSWNENTAEIEFVYQLDGSVIPIEVKSGWKTQAKSLQVFAKKYNPPYRVLMSAKPLSIDPENKIHHYPLYLASHFPLAEAD